MARLILFNKPFGVLSQFTDQQGRATLQDYIPVTGVYAAGRLDRDSEGLLLLTDDGKLQRRLTHPRSLTWKTYWVQVEGTGSDIALEALRGGVSLSDGPTLPARVRQLAPPRLWSRDPPIRCRASIPTSWLEIRIREGRNRQVRRMTAAVGLPTLRLVRITVGRWQLQGIPPGGWREARLVPAAEPSRPHRTVKP